MSRDFAKRLSVIERARISLPAEIRKWLGEPVTDAGLASAERQPIAPLTPAMIQWLAERG